MKLLRIRLLGSVERDETTPIGDGKIVVYLRSGAHDWVPAAASLEFVDTETGAVEPVEYKGSP